MANVGGDLDEKQVKLFEQTITEVLNDVSSENIFNCDKAGHEDSLSSKRNFKWETCEEAGVYCSFAVPTMNS